eukprot:7651906-Pyramimonas_sp.AAC.1
MAREINLLSELLGGTTEGAGSSRLGISRGGEGGAIRIATIGEETAMPWFKPTGEMLSSTRAL